MLKIIQLVLGIYWVLAAGHGWAQTCAPAPQAATSVQIQAAQQHARDHGFLWRMSKGGHSSFLYGTIHVAKFEWLFPGPQVMQALRGSDSMVLEMDMLDAGIQAEIARAMAALPHTTIPPALSRRLQRQAEAYCVPYATLAAMSPEMQVTALTMLVGRKAGLEAEFAIDSVLADIGHRTRKQMVSLETPDLQLQVLHMDSAAETQAFVSDSLDELESGRSQALLERIARAWESADYAEMARFEEWCECLKTDSERAMMRRALDERNPAMAERIDALHMASKQAFVAVGSLHMFGPAGLPILMEKRGYKVEQLSLR